MAEEKPYLEIPVPATVRYEYNPKYGDDRICTCGHPYYRHFDTYENMSNIGCKYCRCDHFKEAADPEFAKKDKECSACGIHYEGEKCPNGCDGGCQSGLLMM